MATSALPGSAFAINRRNARYPAAAAARSPSSSASRGTYVALLALLGLVLPLAQVTQIPRLAAARPERLNLPGRDYWLAPARRAEGLRRLPAHLW